MSVVVHEVDGCSSIRDSDTARLVEVDGSIAIHVGDETRAISAYTTARCHALPTRFDVVPAHTEIEVDAIEFESDIQVGRASFILEIPRPRQQSREIKSVLHDALAGRRHHVQILWVGTVHRLQMELP